ncbi:MAG: hypothetical protein V7629_17610 [Motiliproteus sp.]
MNRSAVLRLLTLVLMLPASFVALAEPLQIAMILWRGNTAAEAGFKQTLSEQGYQAKYHDFDAQQSRDRLAGLLREQLLPALSNYDYIYCFGPPRPR